jgi:hypothetical protein
MAKTGFLRILLILFIFITSINNLSAQIKRPMNWDDVMRFKAMRSPSISENGKWVAWCEEPDRGDGRVAVKSTETDTTYYIERGFSPIISKNSDWVIMSIKPKSIETDNLDKGKEKPKNGIAVLKTSDGSKFKTENVEKYLLSNDSKWLAYKIYSDDKTKKEDSKKIIGTDLILRFLETGSELTFEYVTEFLIDTNSNYLFYIVSEPKGTKNGVYSLPLQSGQLLPVKVHAAEIANYSCLEWNSQRNLLAYICSKKMKNDEPDSCSLFIWSSVVRHNSQAVYPDSCREGWFLPFKNYLKWSKEGSLLFFGFKKFSDTALSDNKTKYADSTFYDINTIEKNTDIDVWHWNDPRIKSNRKNWWNKNKDNTYLQAYSLETKIITPLADSVCPIVLVPENSKFAVGYNDRPYLKSITWDDDYFDLYSIRLSDGSKKLISKHLKDDYTLSPAGNYVAFFKNKHWWLYDNHLDSIYCLTDKIQYPFSMVDWDQPPPAPSYGYAGWLENDDAILLYDQYDIWKCPTGASVGNAFNQTAADGRISEITYRLRNLDPEKKFFKHKDDLYLTGFHNKTKETHLARFNLEILGTETILHENKNISPVSFSKLPHKLLFTKSSYDEFPDLWVADTNFKNIKKISNVNPQMKDILWGKSELINWVSYNNDTLDGFILKPENWSPSKRYPVIVAFYEKYSPLMYNFWQPRMSHWPAFPLYNGEDYIIFMPDIKYKIGYTGQSALNSILPGVRKLGEMGIADTNAVGLWGHSFSGYQSAYIISQTNFFKAAVCGATVSNMTSAYSGIRNETGLARQM